jgi:sulfhydrogenase subunit delta
MGKLRAAFYSLTGCQGEYLTILGMEDILLDLLSLVDIAEFKLASSKEYDGKVDIAFVEGSVSTERDLEYIKRIRGNSKILVALGDCAVWGGIQASTSGQDPKELMRSVYKTEKNLYGFLGEHKGIPEVVPVDYEIQGCPIEGKEFARVLIDLVRDVKPELPDYPVCIECKVREIPCLIVERGLPCLGPITVAGCDARCPSYNTACIGCRGPIRDEANVAGELEMLLRKGYDRERILNLMSLFGARYKGLRSLIEGGKS